MYYAGMVGTRNVPMQTRLEGMKEQKGIETRQKNVEENNTLTQGEEKYKIAGDMQYLVEAETVSNVEEVMENLQNKKLEISNSDMDATRKKISLQQLHNMEEKCNLKIKKLRFEISMEKMIAKAEEEGDQAQAMELRQEYVREKNLRKTGEYSDLQQFLAVNQANDENKKSYTIYNARQKETQLLHEMNEIGNFVDFQAV